MNLGNIYYFESNSILIYLKITWSYLYYFSQGRLFLIFFINFQGRIILSGINCDWFLFYYQMKFFWICLANFHFKDNFVFKLFLKHLFNAIIKKILMLRISEENQDISISILIIKNWVLNLHQTEPLSWWFCKIHLNKTHLIIRENLSVIEYLV